MCCIMTPHVLTMHVQVQLCHGLVGSAQVYDRAEVGPHMITCDRLQGSKQACDSVIVPDELEENGAVRAGRVQRFLSHTPPGQPRCSCDENPDIAYVAWYPPVPDDHPQFDQQLGSPVVRKRLVRDDPAGQHVLGLQLSGAQVRSPAISVLQQPPAACHIIAPLWPPFRAILKQ